MKVLDLPTPALICDADALQGNMARMAGLLEGTGVRLRPHYKSHKCAALAGRQIASGAAGMTCAKLSEAEDLIFSGVEDVLLANQVTDPDKIWRLALLSRLCRLTVCVDGAENARSISEAARCVGGTVRCLVEYDIGMRRCGCRTPEEALAVAQAVAALPNLAFDGIQAYAGYASHMADAAARAAATRENERKVAELAALLRAHGLAVPVVSGGSTGTSALKARGGVYTELQAGSYLFMDSTYGRLDTPFVQSLFVLSTVLSRQGDAVILDAGVKSLGADQDAPAVLAPDSRRLPGRCELNEEHLKLYGSGAGLRPGDKVRIVPGHCCSTVNLYDSLYLFSGDRVTERLVITARGKSQ